MGTIDKTTWPAIQPLPVNLPAAAELRPAKFPASSRVLAGKVADGPHEPLSSIGLGDNESTKNLATRYVGRDPRAALAAAVEATRILQPMPEQSRNKYAPSKTLVGLYQTTKGAYMVAPLWDIPSRGSNWDSYFAPVEVTRAATPDYRFDFHDTHLAAVVTSDGWIRNPDALDPKALQF